MSQLVLDTDTLVDFLRGSPTPLAWFETLSETSLIVPGLVAMDLIQGCENRPDQRRVERLLRPYLLTWLSAEACDAASATFSQFHLSHNLGLLHALISQVAVALDASLCTFDTNHFAAIPSLRVVEPYARVSGDPSTTTST